MSQKQIKRNRKEIRRVVKSEFGEGMESLSNITRKRPKWIPKSIWILAYAPLFEKKYRAMIYKHMK